MACFNVLFQNLLEGNEENKPACIRWPANLVPSRMEHINDAFVVTCLVVMELFAEKYSRSTNKGV